MFECDCLLNATGRVPNVFGVGLDEAGVDYNNRQGVVIDDYFRYTIPQHVERCFTLFVLRVSQETKNNLFSKAKTNNQNHHQ